MRDYLEQTTQLKLKWLDGVTWHLGNYITFNVNKQESQ